MNIEHALKAKNLSNLYAAAVFDVNLFSHLRTEATGKYPNCIFVVSENFANHIADYTDNEVLVDPEFANFVDVETRSELRKQGIVGTIIGCTLTCNTSLPDNVIVAIGHNADFTDYQTRMRVLNFK